VAVGDLPFAVLGATVAALATDQPRLDALLDNRKMRRRQPGGLIAAQRPDVPWQPPWATYLAAGLPAYRRWRATAQCVPGRGRVALELGPRFGTPGSGFVRLNFDTNKAVPAEAIERMASALS
jgi:cysteine-S-conjugate beta-lyase